MPNYSDSAGGRLFGGLALALGGFLALGSFGFLAGRLALHLLRSRSSDHVDHEHLRIRHQRDARRQRDRARGELGADLGALNGDGELIGDRQRLGLDFDGVAVLGDERVRGGFALDDDVDLDVDLLAAAHDEQVGVLDVAADRVDLERLGQRELLLALDVECEHCVGAGVAQHGREVVGVELQVLGVGAVAVKHRGHLAIAPGTPRGALAGLRCGLER